MSIRFGTLRRLLDCTTIAQYRRAALAGVGALFLCGAPSAMAANLIWNSAAGNWVDPNVFSYNNDGAEATASNPFTFVGSDGLAGANTVFIGNDGDVTLNTVDSTYGAGFENLVYGVRVGTTATAANVPGPANYRGSGILRVTGSTPLFVRYQTNDGATGVDGDFAVGQTTAVGEVIWDSTGTLTVEGALRIGQFGAGTFTQNNGTVIGGSNSVGGAFIAIGQANSNNAGTGAYNLNHGELRAGAAQDPGTGVEVRRQFRIGLGADSTGVFNVGDGVGAAGTAKFVTWDEFKLGEDGATGTVNLQSDGRIEVNYAALFAGSGADAPLLIEQGAINQQGGSLDADGLLSFGHVNAASYNITGSTGSINARALTIGDAGTLSYTLDAAGATKMVIEGDLNSAGDTAKGINLGGTSTLTLNNLSSYASNGTLTLIESLDPSVSASGFFSNFAQGQSVGTNSLGTPFFINYFGGVDNNDTVLQTTVASIPVGLVWNTGAASFTNGFARGNGNFGVGTFPADPLASPPENLYLGNNGTATLSTSGTASSLRVGTDQASARIANRDGNGTLNATGSAALTLTSANGVGDLIVGSGGQTGTVNWNSTGTLEAQSKLWVGDGGTGVINQNDGIIAGGTTDAGTFLAVGNGAAGNGTYNLNNGQFRPTGTLDNTLGRVTAVGDNGATGALNVGDGAGAAGSALLEANNDLWIGRDGGTGTLNIESDGRINLDNSIIGGNAEFHVGTGSTGTVVQTGGAVDSMAVIQIGAGIGSVGTYTISGGTLNGASDGSGEFRIGRDGGSGKLRIEGTGQVNYGSNLFVGNLANTNPTGRLEIVGSNAGLTVGKLENAPGGTNGVNEQIFWQADANGITPMIVTGAGSATAALSVQLQDSAEVALNTGSGASLMGDGIALELDLSAIVGNNVLTLIDNQTSEAVTGFFENGTTTDLYEEGATISGTGYAGTVSISYLGGTGNDVILNLTAGAVNDADFDNDGDVDGSDFLTWQRGLGTGSGAANGDGDANGDGAITGADLTVWKDQFGAPAVPAAGAVPEPTSFVILLTAAGLALAGARQRR